MKARIDPVGSFGGRLSGIDKPARYIGGESGATLKPDAGFRVALCFPDLYEIGMANNAMRILYAGLNALEGVACERVFSPAADFEALMRETGTPAYGLESGTPVRDADILAFTVGYELLATNMLGMLDLAGIPLDAAGRRDGQPLVIAGGPAITNPVPFSGFLDAVWIGEAEDAFFALVAELSLMKAGGAARADLLGRLRRESAFWMPRKKAVRAVYPGFSRRVYGHAFPVPVVKPVQDHGVVELMRGCPNGCRFCHAGYFYRPQRLRDPDVVLREVETQVRVAGHREISLSSLSSGDYPGIFELLRELNRRWKPERVSFQLPSLKVESFPLALIDEISGTRKSGLTFAVETPLEQWQMTLNKRVGMEKIQSILAEAESKGYRLAKFYFMVGLPLPEAGQDEVEAIIAFVRRVADASSLRINLTVATFVPKAHTPFQWCAQLGPEEASRRIYAIKDAFRGDQRVKVSYHAPFLSWLEGLVSRGDERVGELVLSAYRHGARFDAWDDLFRKDAWEAALSETAFDPSDMLAERSTGRALPWDGVNLRVGKAYLKTEWERSRQSLLSHGCADPCDSPCGACGDALSAVDEKTRADILASIAALSTDGVFIDTGPAPAAADGQGARRRILLNYEKTGGAAYYAHHTVWNLVAGSFEKAGISLEYSQGFNPQPRLETSEPLSLGTSSLDEYAIVILRSDEKIPAEAIADKMGRFLPRGLSLRWTREIEGYVGKKFPSLSSIHWGSVFGLDVSASVYGAGELAEGLKAASAGQAALAELAVEEVDGALRILLPFAGKREFGLSALFEKATGSPLRDSGIAITREAQYAKLDGTRISYSRYFRLEL